MKFSLNVVYMDEVLFGVIGYDKYCYLDILKNRVNQQIMNQVSVLKTFLSA